MHLPPSTPRTTDNEGRSVTGDFVLKEVARRVRTRVRKEEVFARYGGEEFAVLFSATSVEEAAMAVERAPLAASANKSATSRARTSRPFTR